MFKGGSTLPSLWLPSSQRGADSMSSDTNQMAISERPSTEVCWPSVGTQYPSSKLGPQQNVLISMKMADTNSELQFSDQDVNDLISFFKENWHLVLSSLD